MTSNEARQASATFARFFYFPIRIIFLDDRRNYFTALTLLNCYCQFKLFVSLKKNTYGTSSQIIQKRTQRLRPQA